jgi:hypothetical protein
MYVTAIWQKFLGGSVGVRWNQTKANNPVKLGWTNVTTRNFAVGQTLLSSKHWGETNVVVKQTSRLDKRLGRTNVLIEQTSWSDKRRVTVWLSKLKRVLKDWPMITTNYYEIYQLLTWPLIVKITLFNLMVLNN